MTNLIKAATNLSSRNFKSVVDPNGNRITRVNDGVFVLDEYSPYACNIALAYAVYIREDGVLPNVVVRGKAAYKLGERMEKGQETIIVVPEKWTQMDGFQDWLYALEVGYKSYYQNEENDKATRNGG